MGKAPIVKCQTAYVRFLQHMLSYFKINQESSREFENGGEMVHNTEYRNGHPGQHGTGGM